MHLSLYSDKYYYGCAGNKSYDLNSKSVAYSSGVHLCRYNVGDDRQVLFDGSAGMSLYDKPSTNARKLLIGRRETTANYTGYIYDLVITSRVTNAELVHLVPVQGCDSDESGFYDLMRQRFYRPLAGSLTPDLTRGDVVRLEYAEFTSGAFLDTGLKITAENNCRLEFKFAAATTYINDEHVIGTALSSGSEKYIHWTAYSKGNVATTRAWYFGCNGAGDYNTLNKAAWSAGEHDVKYGVGQERQVVLDGAVVGTLPGAPTTGTSTLCIGKRGTAVNFTGKFRTLTVWRQTSDFSSSTKIMHLIPVQDRKTHAVFFYDKVSKTLLSPNGTVNAGPKAVGPVIIIK